MQYLMYINSIFSQKIVLMVTAYQMNETALLL